MQDFKDKGGSVNTNSYIKGVPKRIIWAIDPFHEAPREQLKAAKVIQYLFQGTPIFIEPVSMLLSGRYDPAARVFMEDWQELSSGAQKNLDGLFKNLKLEGLQPPRLEKQKGASVSSATKGLIRFALDEGADFIVVSSHARKGAARLLLGSFAETLVLQSPIPVVVVNPNAKPTQKLKNILYPTDFSDKSKAVFEEVLVMAKKLNCKILLFHKAQYLYPSFGYPFVVPPVSTESMKDFVEAFKATGQEWVQYALSRGVVVRCHVSSKPGYAVDEITRAAAKLGSSGLIAMASQSGRVSSILLGSLTRQVLRNAPCPVVVLHPDQESLVEHTVEEIKKAAIEFGRHPLMT